MFSFFNAFKDLKVVKDPKIRRILQTKTVSWQVVENQQVYIWQKICLRYFKISQTYFELSPLYFQLSAGVFLSCKNFFLKVGYGINLPCLHRLVAAGSVFPLPHGFAYVAGKTRRYSRKMRHTAPQESRKRRAERPSPASCTAAPAIKNETPRSVCALRGVSIVQLAVKPVISLAPCLFLRCRYP